MLAKIRQNLARMPLVVIYLGFLSLSLIVYWGLWQTFYQQDEWYTHGHELIESFSHFFFSDYTYWHIIFGEGRILSRLLYSFFVKEFAFPIEPVAFFAIVVHALNAFLVFLIGEKITGKRAFGLMAGLIFVVNNVSQEAVTWIAASVGTLPATSLVLLAVYLYKRYLDEEKSQYLVGAFLAWLISISFKELGIGFIFLFPLMAWFWQKKSGIGNMLRKCLPFLLYGFAAISFRLINLLTSSAQIGSSHVTGQGFVATVTTHMIVYPLVGFFQSLIPIRDLLLAAKSTIVLVYPFFIPTPIKELIAQTVVSDLLAILGGAALIIAVLLFNQWLGKDKQKIDWKLFSFILIWNFLSYAPYTILNRGGSYLESRYYYLGVISAGFMAAYLLSPLFQRNLIWRLLAVIVLFSFCSYHTLLMRDGMKQLIGTSQDRRRVFDGMEVVRSDLTDKNIFYVTGNYSYSPNNWVPLLQGAGYAIMVWFYSSDKIPRTLLQEDYLWELGSQGYREVDGRGFGYFVDLEQLKLAYRQHHLAPENVVGFSWNKDTKELTNITQSIRAQLPTE